MRALINLCPGLLDLSSNSAPPSGLTCTHIAGWVCRQAYVKVEVLPNRLALLLLHHVLQVLDSVHQGGRLVAPAVSVKLGDGAGRKQRAGRGQQSTQARRTSVSGGTIKAPATAGVGKQGRVSKPGRQACHQPATHLMPLLRGKRIEKPVAKILVRMQRKSACTSSTMLPCGSLIHLRGRSRPVILKAVGWAG